MQLQISNKMVFTIAIKEIEDGWLMGQCEQVPEAITQGKDIDELMENIQDAIEEALEMRKEDYIANHKWENSYRRILYLPNEKKRTAKTSSRKRVYA